jgi:hypothetical protein
MPLHSTEALQAEAAQLRSRVSAYLGPAALQSIIDQATALRDNWSSDGARALVGRLKADELDIVQVKKRLAHVENELRNRGVDENGFDQPT